MRKAGVGMIGFGFIGKVHAHAHRALPLFYDPLPIPTELVAVCTSNSESAKHAETVGGFRHSYVDYREIIDNPDIEIVHICLPNDLHAEPTLAAINAGKHVYCEKPLANDANTATVMCEAAFGAETVNQVTFNYRFVPAIMRAAQLIDAGFLGSLLSFRFAYLHAGYVDQNRPYSWRTDMARSGGGAIMDLGSHALDLVQFLLDRSAVERGGRISNVQANLETIVTERPDRTSGEMRTVDVDDIAHVVCRLDGGAIGTVEASKLATGVQDELRFEIHGTKGGLKFNLMDANYLEAYDASIRESELGGDRGYRRIECVTRYPRPYSLGATKNTVGWLNFHIHSLFDFVTNVANVQNGLSVHPNSPSFAAGYAVQQVIAACQLSDISGGEWKSTLSPIFHGHSSGKPLI